MEFIMVCILSNKIPVCVYGYHRIHKTLVFILDIYIVSMLDVPP